MIIKWFLTAVAVLFVASWILESLLGEPYRELMERRNIPYSTLKVVASIGIFIFAIIGLWGKTSL